MNPHLPKGWKEVRLGEVAQLVGGGTPTRSKPSLFTGSILWITPTEIDKSKIKIVRDSREKITNEALKESSAKIIPADAVLLTSRATIGYTAIAGIPLTTNQGFASFICDESTFNWYLAYWLKHKRKFLNDNAKGTTFKEISKSVLKELEFPLPPLPEQKRIVAKIEELFSDLDKAVESLKKAQAQLKTYRQAVLKYAFEGRLFNDKYEMKTVQEICQIIDGDRGTNYPKKNDFTNRGYCLFLNTSNVRNTGFNFDECQFISKEKHEKLRKGIVEVGDVVFTSRGTLGNAALLDDKVKFKIVRINSGMLILRPKAGVVTGKYLQHYLRSPHIVAQIRKMSSGTAQPQLPIREFKDFTISFPAIETQNKIVLKLEQILSEVDYLEYTILQNLEKADATRQSILKKAFEGRLI